MDSRLRSDCATLTALQLLREVGLLNVADTLTVVDLARRMSQLVFDDIIKIQAGESRLIRAGARLAP